MPRKALTQWHLPEPGIASATERPRRALTVCAHRTILARGQPATSRHPSLLEQCLEQTGVGGNLVNDAHLAALAREYDATVISFDRDFGRFEGVRWRLPG